MSLSRRVRSTATALWSQGRGPTLAAVAVGWFLALGVRLAFPAVLPYVRADLGIDTATAGALVTALWMAYAVVQFPSGLLTDRVGERRVLTAGTFLGGVAALALGLTSGLAGIVLGVVLYGLGTGLFATPRVMVISRIYPGQSATALGVVFAAGNVGSTALPALAGVAADALGWRGGFLVAAPLFLAAAVGIRLALSDAPRSHGADEAAPSDGDLDVAAVAAALRRRPVQFVTAILVLFAFAFQGLVGFLPTYLVDAKGLAPGLASTLFGAYFASGLVAQLVSGGLADAHGRRAVLVGALAITVAGVAALTVADRVGTILAVVLLLGLQLGFWPVINAYAYDALSGGGYGLVRTVYLGLGATGPLVVGTLFDANRYDGAIFALVGVFVAVLALCVALPSLGAPAGTARAD